MIHKNTRYYLAASVSLLTAVVYLRVLHYQFIDWDDVYYVKENPHIRSLDLSLLKWSFLDFYIANWHPLTWLSHAADYAVWGLNPFGHHLTNIVLHAANTFIVVLLVARLVDTVNGKQYEVSSRGPSAYSLVPGSHSRFTLIAAGVTGLFFGLHPLHVESVAWVAERKDLLCAFFFLLGIMTYMRYVSGRAVVTEPGLRFLNKHYFVTLILFILALLSKPMAVSLPAVLLILDWYPFEKVRSLKTLVGAIFEKIPFIVLSLSSSALTILAQNAGRALISTETIPLSSRALVSVRALIAYLWKMIVPLNLVPFYPYPGSPSFFSLNYLLPILLASLITFICVAVAGKRKVWAASWAYYVITLVPVIGIVQVGSQSMADRYTYLPGLGPFLIAGIVASWIYWKAETLTEHSLIARLGCGVTAAILLFSLICLTVQQAALWKDSFSLWNYVIERQPGAAIAYNGRAVAFYRIREYDKSIRDLSKAVELNPHYGTAFYNLACVYSVQQKTAEACAALRKGVEKGYRDWRQIESDPDLDNIRSLPCYGEAIETR